MNIELPTNLTLAKNNGKVMLKVPSSGMKTRQHQEHKRANFHNERINSYICQ